MPDEVRITLTERGIQKVALMRGDAELSRTLVVPMVMRIGRAEVRMDGIGGVATPEEHRNKGYSRRVLEAAIEHMLAGDASLSTLYGIPHYYPKFGYATLGPEYTLALQELDTRDEMPAGLTIRRGTAGDLSAVQRLYRQETARAYGAVLRDDDWWVWHKLAEELQAGEDELRVVVRGSRVVGYAWRGGGFWWMEHVARDGASVLRIAEAFAADADAADAVLTMCRRWARETGLDGCELAIPPDNRVSQAAMFHHARFAAQYHDEAEFMGRVTGLVSLLRALAPELEVRWRSAAAMTPPFAMTIASGAERVTISGSDAGLTLEAGGRGDTVVELDPGSLARLATGGFAPERVLERAGVSTAARPVLTALFPQHIPYIYPPDRF